MRTKRPVLIDVGIFVTVGLGLALIAVFLIGREKNFFEKRYTLVASYKDISGLRAGAIVQLAGLNVGYVDGIRFSRVGNQDRLDVLMNINKRYQERIRKDSQASIQTQGLLGDKFILVTTGTMGMPSLADGDSITTGEGGGFNQLADVGTKALKDIQEVAKSFQLDKEDKGNVKKILANFEKTSSNWNVITQKIKNGEGTIGALIMDPSLYFDMRALMGHANRNKLLKNMVRATIEEQEKATAKPIGQEK